MSKGLLGGGPSLVPRPSPTKGNRKMVKKIRTRFLGEYLLNNKIIEL